jgi:hypothetical protein
LHFKPESDKKEDSREVIVSLELKCEFPEGCMLDIFAMFSKQNTSPQVKVLVPLFGVPDDRSGE